MVPEFHKPQLGDPQFIALAQLRQHGCEIHYFPFEVTDKSVLLRYVGKAISLTFPDDQLPRLAYPIAQLWNTLPEYFQETALPGRNCRMGLVAGENFRTDFYFFSEIEPIPLKEDPIKLINPSKPGA